MTRVIPGFGETLPLDLPSRQVALKRMLDKQDERQKKIHEKLKARYVEPEGTSETERGQDDQK